MVPERNLGLGVGLNFERQKAEQSMSPHAAGVKCGVVLAVLSTSHIAGLAVSFYPSNPEWSFSNKKIPSSP